MKPAKIVFLLLTLLSVLLTSCKAGQEPTGTVPAGKPSPQIGPLEAWDTLTTCCRHRRRSGT